MGSIWQGVFAALRLNRADRVGKQCGVEQTAVFFKIRTVFWKAISMRYIILALQLLSTTWGVSYSSSAFAGDFMATGVDARAMGMGGAYFGLADGAEAVYWNPAGLAGMSGSEAKIEHAERFSGIHTQDFLAVGTTVATGWVGIGILRGGVDGIVFSDSSTLANPSQPVSIDNLPDPSKTFTFSNTDITTLLSYARPLTQDVVVGATAKLISRSIHTSDAFGYGLDLGVSWRPWRWMSLALVLADVTGTRVSWDGGTTDVVRPTLRLGMVQRLQIPGTSSSLTISTTILSGTKSAGYGGIASLFNISGETGNRGSVGLEYGFRGLLYIRAGSQNLGGTLGDGDAQITTGLGLRMATPFIDRWISAISFDIAWQNHTLNSSYPMTITAEL